MTSPPQMGVRAGRAVKWLVWYRCLLKQIGLTDDYENLVSGNLRRAVEDAGGDWIAGNPPRGEFPTPAQVASLTRESLLECRNVGPKTVGDIEAWLAWHALKLSDHEPLPHDPLAANVYADWLDENDEPRAAAKLRAAFPVHDGKVTQEAE